MGRLSVYSLLVDYWQWLLGLAVLTLVGLVFLIGFTVATWVLVRQLPTNLTCPGSNDLVINESRCNTLVAQSYNARPCLRPLYDRLNDVCNIHQYTADGTPCSHTCMYPASGTCRGGVCNGTCLGSCSVTADCPVMSFDQEFFASFPGYLVGRTSIGLETFCFLDFLPTSTPDTSLTNAFEYGSELGNLTADPDTGFPVATHVKTTGHCRYSIAFNRLALPIDGERLQTMSPRDFCAYAVGMKHDDRLEPPGLGYLNKVFNCLVPTDARLFTSQTSVDPLFSYFCDYEFTCTDRGSGHLLM